MKLKNLLMVSAILICGIVTFNSHAEDAEMSITLGENERLKEQLGENIYTVEKLTLSGVPSDEDFQTLWECGFSGKLRSIDLTDLDTYLLPSYAFYHPEEQGELGSDSFIPLSITEIRLPQKLFLIPPYCFAGLKITEMEFPFKLAYIEGYAFAYSSIERIEVNPLLERMMDYVFTHTKLKEVNLIKHICYVGEGCFDDCKDLNTLLIPLSFRMNETKHGVARRCNLNNVYFSDTGSYILLEGDFADNKNLHVVEITEGIKEVRGNAFSGCDLEQLIFDGSPMLGDGCFADYPLLKEIYCKSTIPPGSEINWSGKRRCPFGGTTPQTATVYIPVGCTDTYKNTPGWDYFKNFVETDNFPTSVEGVSADGAEDGVKVYGKKEAVVCSNGTAKPVDWSVFGFDGRCIANGTTSGCSDTSVAVSPGLYIVRMADKTFKVVVR